MVSLLKRGKNDSTIQKKEGGLSSQFRRGEKSLTFADEAHKIFLSSFKISLLNKRWQFR